MAFVAQASWNLPDQGRLFVSLVGRSGARAADQASALIVQPKSGFSAHQLDVPAIVQGVGVVEGPRGHVARVFKARRNDVRRLRALHGVDRAVACRRTWRSRPHEPLNDIHEVRSLIGAVASGVVPKVAPGAKAHGLELMPRRWAEEGLPVHLLSQGAIVQRL